MEASALEAIMTYCKNIEVVKALYDLFHIERFPQRRPGMDTVNRFLMSCPTLKVFDVIEHCILVDDYSFRGRSKFYEYGEPIADTMKLSRDSGLERLAGLKYLEIFGFEGTDHRVGKQGLKWMANQWPNLRIMRGLAKDNLLYLKYDTKKAALHEYMMSLRPDVEQNTLFTALSKVQLGLSLEQCSEHILGADKNAMADLLDLDFGSSSEPAYSSPPVSSSSQKRSSGGPNYSADLFDMSSDIGSRGGRGAFGGMGGMGGMSGMGMSAPAPATSTQMSTGRGLL
ncbi:hypothetical protein KVV02_000368 [Mortierella alpina]|uniref:Uncharacterized protein n=1 Tax=Mortierella alpina TaxID=64518 RepID=A0A9P8A0H0_MORAP|nr:hypothetical protein KVV02_000368 [Mortierella alpina]